MTDARPEFNEWVPAPQIVDGTPECRAVEIAPRSPPFRGRAAGRPTADHRSLGHGFPPQRREMDVFLERPGTFAETSPPVEDCCARLRAVLGTLTPARGISTQPGRRPGGLIGPPTTGRVRGPAQPARLAPADRGSPPVPGPQRRAVARELETVPARAAGVPVSARRHCHCCSCAAIRLPPASSIALTLLRGRPDDRRHSQRPSLVPEATMAQRQSRGLSERSRTPACRSSCRVPTSGLARPACAPCALPHFHEGSPVDRGALSAVDLAMRRSASDPMHRDLRRPEVSVLLCTHAPHRCTTRRPDEYRGDCPHSPIRTERVGPEALADDGMLTARRSRKSASTSS